MKRNVNLEYLRDQADALPEPLRTLCHEVLDDPKFRTCPASIKWHHAYRNGLLEHTAEVMERALLSTAGKNGVDRDVVRTAVIFHDYGKTREYEYHGKNGWSETPYRSLIYHIAGGYAEWCVRAGAAGVEQEMIDRVGHVILAHHGRKEWGSPVEPQTPEAWVVHSADMWSARWGGRKPVQLKLGLGKT